MDVKILIGLATMFSGESGLDIQGYWLSDSGRAGMFTLLLLAEHSQKREYTHTDELLGIPGFESLDVTSFLAPSTP